MSENECQVKPESIDSIDSIGSIDEEGVVPIKVVPVLCQQNNTMVVDGKKGNGNVDDNNVRTYQNSESGETSCIKDVCTNDDHSLSTTEEEPVVNTNSSSPTQFFSAPKTSSSLEDQPVLAFKALCNFVKALNDVFGERQFSLQLYSHLLEKTGIINEEPIQKHLHAFRQFVKANEKNIVEQRLPLIFGEIRYSDRVYIDLQKIMQWADKDEKQVIWKHLLTISAIIDPTGPAKEILRQLQQGETKEEDFLANLLKKIMDNVNMDSQNPMEMISGLLSSGILNDVLGKFNQQGEDGLDISKLLQTVQTMMTTFGSMMNPPTQTSTSHPSSIPSNRTVQPKR